jgi:hypothetical protein
MCVSILTFSALDGHVSELQRDIEGPNHVTPFRGLDIHIGTQNIPYSLTPNILSLSKIKIN